LSSASPSANAIGFVVSLIATLNGVWNALAAVVDCYWCSIGVRLFLFIKKASNANDRGLNPGDPNRVAQGNSFLIDNWVITGFLLSPAGSQPAVSHPPEHVMEKMYLGRM
jgi:hypothetical protein